MTATPSRLRVGEARARWLKGLPYRGPSLLRRARRKTFVAHQRLRQRILGVSGAAAVNWYSVVAPYGGNRA